MFMLTECSQQFPQPVPCRLVPSVDDQNPQISPPRAIGAFMHGEALSKGQAEVQGGTCSLPGPANVT